MTADKVFIAEEVNIVIKARHKLLLAFNAG